MASPTEMGLIPEDMGIKETPKESAIEAITSLADSKGVELSSKELLQKELLDAERVIATLSAMSEEDYNKIPQSFRDAITNIATLSKETPPFTFDEGPPENSNAKPFLELNIDIDEKKREKDKEEIINSEFFQELQRKRENVEA